jgi:hypothetical protein
MITRTGVNRNISLSSANQAAAFYSKNFGTLSPKDRQKTIRPKSKGILIKLRVYNILVGPVLISHSDLSLGQYYTQKDLAVNALDSSHVVPIY